MVRRGCRCRCAYEFTVRRKTITALNPAPGKRLALLMFLGMPRQLSNSIPLSADTLNCRHLERRTLLMKSVCILLQNWYDIDARVRRKAEALVAAGHSVDVLALAGPDGKKAYKL